MKKIKILFTLQLLAFSLLSQSPKQINYQGVARTADGIAIAGQTISLKFELHQGSSTGTVSFTEQQSVLTNSLGLFSTQIGKVNTTDINLIDWEAGPFFLEVSIDPTGASSFTSLGTQQLSSVPYALHALSVPASFTNNILSIGSHTFALLTGSAGSTYSAGAGIAINSGSIINTAPDVSVALTPSTNIGITGTYPNFTVASTPSLTLSGNTLSISGGNSVVISTTITATPLTNITSSGIGTITSSGTNTFDINIPAVVMTPSTNVSVGGSFPNFTLSSTPSLSLLSPNTLSISGGNTVSIAPSLGFSGGVLTVGPNTNTVSIAQGNSTSTLVGSGIAAVSPSVGNNFTVTVQTPTFTSVGPSSITGTYPNLTITSPTVPATTPNTTITPVAGGIVSISNPVTNSFAVTVQTPTFTSVGPSSITGTYPNLTLTSPTVPTLITPTVIGSGIAVVSPSVGNNFTVSVNQPTFAYSQATGSLTSGTSSAYITPNLTFTNNVLTSGPASNSVLVSSGWGLTGNAATTPSLNFIGTTDNNALNFRVNNQKSGGIDHVLFNSSFGYQSYLSNITGSVNAAFGHQAMYSNTSGFRNAGFGYQALYNNTSGVNNTGVGYQALYGVSTGQSNVGIGFQALGNNNGSSNIGIGANSMLQNTSGQSNIAIGLLALFPNTNGNDNTLMGTQTFFNNTSGSSNVALGAFTGYSNVTGSGNVFLGKNAGYYEMGSNKLYISNTTTSVSPLIYGDFLTGNVGIGTTAANAPLQFNNNIIGRKIVLWEGFNNDHQVYGFGLSSNILRYQVDAAVGNHVFFSGINSSSSLELMRIQGNGRVGINNSAPTATLDVNGTMKLTDGTQGAGKVLTSDAAGNASWQAAGGGPWTQTGGTVALTTFTNNVGIGNNNPTSRLDVTGSSTFAFPVLKVTNTNSASLSGALDVSSNASAAASIANSSSSGIGLVVNTTGPAISVSNSGASHAIYASNTSTSALNSTAGFFDGGVWLRGKNASGSAFALFAQDVNSNSLFLIRNDGNVGIGTSNPTAKLEITSSSSSLLRLATTGTNSNVNFDAAPTGSGNLQISAGTATSNGFAVNTNNLTRFSIAGTGNVGVGALTPQHLFSIGNTSSDNQLFAMRVFQQTSSNINGWLGAAAFGGTTSAVVVGELSGFAVIGAHTPNLGGWADLSVNPGGGNVGIGMGLLGPHAPLQFGNSGPSRKIVLWETANNDHQIYGFEINSNVLRYQVDATVSDHVFYAGTSGSTSNELLRIKGNGRVGVNNSAPTATLDVLGTMKLVDGTQGAGKVLTSDAAGNASWQAAGGGGWSLTGNAATTPSLNFVGTTDNNALNFRVSNTKSGTIDHVLANVFFGFQSGSSITSGSLNAGYGHQALKSNSTGGKNTAVGYLALNGNIGGNDNTAVGYSALQANANAIQNTAMGKDALYSNTTGSQNSAFGLGAMLLNVSGNSNVAVGKDVLALKTSGDNNVALGYNAGYNNLIGSSNVFIGYQAGYNETGSNKLIIANTSTSVSPLIYGDFSTGMIGLNTPVLGGVLSIDNQSVTTRDAIHIYNARDQIGAGMPMEIDAVTVGQTYGSNTYGRILRLNNLTQGQIYDFGVGNTGNFFIAAGNNYAPAAFNISTGGNIGIGISSPAYKLDVVGTGGPRARVFSQDGNFAGYLSKNTSREFFAGVQGTFESGGGVNSGYHIFDNTAGAQRMVIDYTGNMGIGNFNPTEKLVVAGNIQIPGANNYQYATAKTNYATVSAASFASINGLLLDGNSSGNAKWIMSGTGGVLEQLFATIQIPNAATITAVTVYVTDNDVTYNLDADLVRFNMTSNVISPIATTNATSGAPGISAISATGLSSVVDNSNYSYFIQLNTRQNNTNLWIRGAKVTYIVDKAD